MTTNIITIKTEPYNNKRYSKPYIALLNPDDLKVIKWGSWLGTDGFEGELSLELETAERTCIIMHGQKDHRNARRSAPSYRVYSEGKILIETASRYEAVKTYHAQHCDSELDAHP